MPGARPSPAQIAPRTSSGARREPFRFQTDGVETAATLSLPRAARGRVPAVVTGPGFGGVKEMLIPAYADALAARGIACLAFDPVNFGASAGRRRQHVDPGQQRRSFAAALEALGRDARVDPERLGVFGTSLAGAHALRSAADDPQVRCAVVIVPFIRLRGIQSPRVAARVALEVVRRALGRADRTIATAGAPGELAAMTTDGAIAWLREMTSDAPTFRNEVTRASLLALTTYRVGAAASRVSVPTLVIVAERDSITPGSLVRSAMRGAPGATFMSFPDTHFELFTTHLQATVDATADWFETHLLGASTLALASDAR